MSLIDTLFRDARTALIATAASAALALPGCASDPVAPEGFTLALQLAGVNASTVDEVRLVFVPQAAPGAPGMPRFAATPPASYFDGGVETSVDSQGQLVLRVSGEYLRTNGVPQGASGLDPRLELELWSDDTAMRTGPQMLGYVVIGGAQLAMGSAYLPDWPVPLGETQTLTLRCNPGSESLCNPPAP